MGFEVDVGGIGPFTITEGSSLTKGLVWPGEVAPLQWFRLGISLQPSAEENPPGTSLVLASERIGVQGDGQTFAEMTILNNGNTGGPFMAATYSLNVLSSPSHQ